METDRQDPQAKWLERAKELPESPGVYIMKDADDRVIYVGKAKVLRNRVRSYFSEGSSDYRAFIGLLGDLLADLETVVTRSEKEALLLERELIKRHEPCFNIIWKDDKQYLCLRIDPSAEYPWVQVVRKMGKDGSRYFGPFHSASAARETLRVVNRHFQLRTCRDSVLYKRTRPCLQYQIGRCPAPCVYEIDRDAYKEGVEHVLLFLEGKGDQLVTLLKKRMWDASDRMGYEVAMHYRDQMRAVEKTLEQQKVAFPSLLDQDAFGIHREGADIAIASVEVRSGRVQNVHAQLFGLPQAKSEEWDGSARPTLRGAEDEVDDSHLLESFLLQRYSSGLSVPPEVLVPQALEGQDALAEILSETRGRKVTIKVPQRGDRRALIQLAQENAQHGFEELQRKTGALHRTLASLQKRLRLKRFPQRIECFDISNFGGNQMVGSRVTFLAAMPSKKDYRHYHIKDQVGQDDFAAMYEVLSRRFRGSEQDLPDLVVVDGGKGQLNVAQAVLKDLEISTVDLASLAKSRVIGVDESDSTVRSPERVFLLGVKDPIIFKDRNAPEILLLARIRDEAHRFAVTFHQRTRRRSRLRSGLEDIPGIGPIRRKALLSHLGSLRKLSVASKDDLGAVPGIGPKAAETIWNALHGGEKPEQ